MLRGQDPPLLGDLRNALAVVRAVGEVRRSTWTPARVKA
jgi:hypothetical protein